MAASLMDEPDSEAELETARRRTCIAGHIQRVKAQQLQQSKRHPSGYSYILAIAGCSGQAEHYCGGHLGVADQVKTHSSRPRSQITPPPAVQQEVYYNEVCLKSHLRTEIPHF